MSSFYVTRIGLPASSFESWSIEEGVVDSNEPLADAILNGIQIVCAKLVGDKTSSASSAGCSKGRWN